MFIDLARRGLLIAYSIVVNSKDNQKRLQEDKKRLFPIYQLKYQRKVIELDVYQ